MAQFDEELAALQAKLEAMNKVLAEHPDVATKVVAAVDSATVDTAAVTEDKAQDDARANALKRLLEQSPIGKDAPGKPAPDAAPGA